MRSLALRHTVMASTSVTERSSLWPYQRRVVDDFWHFFSAAEDNPSPRGRFGRIVLPPRTGKTIIAAQIIATTGLRALFVVPTRTLVEQTAIELERWLSRAVGAYFGERKALADGGVNVTTYALLQSEWRSQNVWPEAIRAADLVFLDEGHHVMTPERLAIIEQGFSPDALRIALTATPDYDEQRTLCRFFPSLIHEMTLEEALELGLLAPLRVWVAEVDAAGSEVRLAAGDYDEELLGRVMSGVPFFEAAARFRYARPNRSKPALVACASRQQASDLLDYFERHRPSEAPRPRLLLGETPRASRQLILEAFERGRIDTLIQVSVLVEGWSSPRCKLLIDLAPSLSVVRSTQKYFRVMTASNAEEARIFVLLPDGLPGQPVLPTDLFGSWLEDYECGALISADERGGPARELAEAVQAAAVRVRQRIVGHRRLEPPRLDREDRAGIAHVLQSCSAFRWHRPPSYDRFRQLRINHPLYTGTGFGLLRWLNYATTPRGYARFLSDLHREAAAADAAEEDRAGLTSHEAERLLAALGEPAANERERAAFAAGWRALAGPAADPDAAETLDPEARLLRAEQSDLLTFALRLLPVRRRRIVSQYFGMAGQRARSTREIADTEVISAGRAADIVQRGCADIRWLLTRARKLPSLPLPSQRRPREASEEQYRRLLLIAADRSITYSRYSASPELYARPPRRMRHDRAFPARWYRLPRPIALHETALLLQRLSQRLNIDQCITMTMVSEQGPQTPESSAGAERIDAFWWQTPFFWAKHQGGEARGIGVDADIVVPGDVALCLTGAGAAFLAYSVRSSSSTRGNTFESAWLDLVSHRAGSEA